MDAEAERKLLGAWRASAAEGVALPSESSLADAVGVSRPTLREALVRMEAEGLVKRSASAGTFPNRLALDAPFRIDQAFDIMDAMLEAGLIPSLEILSAEWSQLTEREADSLEREAGDSCFRTVKMWSAEGTPVVVAVDTIPARYREGLETVGKASVFDQVSLLRGQEVEWERALVRPSPADAERARLLRVEQGAPLLELEVTGASRHGEPLYGAVEAHNLAAFDYTVVRSVRHRPVPRR